jgi:hypothetical protein
MTNKIVYLVFIRQGDNWDVLGVFEHLEDAEKQMECTEDRVGSHNLYLHPMELL